MSETESKREILERRIMNEEVAPSTPKEFAALLRSYIYWLDNYLEDERYRAGYQINDLQGAMITLDKIDPVYWAMFLNDRKHDAT